MAKPLDVVVVGAGPAGVFAALRAADLGARTTLLTKGAFGGMAANDGPVPVRTLAHAARLMRETRQLEQYGISTGPAALDYGKLLARAAEVVDNVGRHAALRREAEALGVTLHEHTGPVRFLDPHTVETQTGRRFTADRFIICAGGVSRRLPIEGFELTCTHSDAWSLTAAPASMLIVGGGATAAQVASVFHAFGTGVQLFEAGKRILPTEDEDVSIAMANAFRRSGIAVHEAFGQIDSFEKTPAGVRMNFSKDGASFTAEAALVVAAVGWSAASEGMDLANAGIETNARSFIAVDDQMRTSAPHIFAAGDITGRLMLAPQAMHSGFIAATNAVTGATESAAFAVNPIGSFTDPEYAQVGLTEEKARATGEPILAATVEFDDVVRPIIDGRTRGFLKLIAAQKDGRILGCHIVGERAVDIVQLAAVAMAAGMDVQALSRVPFSFPTYAGLLARAAAKLAYMRNRGEDVPGGALTVN